MADKQPVKSKSKRRVKDPETFRERALKANEAADKPGRTGRAKRSSRPKPPKPPKFLAKPLRLVGKVILPAYLRNSWRELRLVTWPGWKQSRQLTFAVLIFAVIFGAVISVVDYGLDKIFRNILLK